MFRFLVDGQSFALQIFICSTDISMARLITCDHDTGGVRQIPDASIFERVELVAVRELELFAYLIEVVPIDFRRHWSPGRFESGAEQVTVIIGRKDIQVYHHLDDCIIKTDHSVPSVLTDRGGDKDLLVGQGYVLELYLGDFHRPDEGVVSEGAKQQEVWIFLLKVFPELLKVFRREGASFLVTFGDDLDTVHRVLKEISFFYEPVAE